MVWILLPPCQQHGWTENWEEGIILMSISRRCPFYRKSETLSMCWGTGYCSLDESRARCKGVVESCKDPMARKKYFPEHDKGSSNLGAMIMMKKDHDLRPPIALPLEYRRRNEAYPQTGVTGDLSETDSAVYSIFKELCVGEEITLRILFANGYELDSFKAIAKVVSKKAHAETDWKGYLYWLRFLHLSREDRKKLRLACAQEECPEGRSEERTILTQRPSWGPAPLGSAHECFVTPLPPGGSGRSSASGDRSSR